MATISVIIPTFGEADRVQNLVRALMAQGFDEIIVADASDDDGTCIAAAAAGATCLANLARGRGRQMHAGALAAKCDILFFLHADSIVPAAAFVAIGDCLSHKDTVAGCFRLAFDRRHPVLDIYSWCSRLNVRVTTYGDQGLFVRKATYDQIGGFADIDLMEDFEIQARLRPLGRFVKLPLEIITSARRFVRFGIVAQQMLNIMIVLAYLCGVPPNRLARWYHCKR
jgi:rSAM/selenodomain-associated transferase 2